MAEEKTKEEQDLQNRLYQSIGFEVAANTAVDAATGWLMPAPPVYAGVNFVASGAINTLAQLWRQDDNFSWGEVGASSAIGIVPGLGGKGVTGIAKATVKGAGLGVAHESIRVGVDEQRLLTPEEVAGGALLGGAFGGGTKVIGDSVGVLAKHQTDKIATRRAKGSYTRPGTYTDRTDIWKPDDLTGPPKTYERFAKRTYYPTEPLRDLWETQIQSKSKFPTDLDRMREGLPPLRQRLMDDIDTGPKRYSDMTHWPHEDFDKLIAIADEKGWTVTQAKQLDPKGVRPIFASDKVKRELASKAVTDIEVTKEVNDLFKAKGNEMLVEYEDALGFNFKDIKVPTDIHHIAILRQIATATEGMLPEWRIEGGKFMAKRLKRKIGFDPENAVPLPRPFHKRLHNIINKQIGNKQWNIRGIEKRLNLPKNWKETYTHRQRMPVYKEIIDPIARSVEHINLFWKHLQTRAGSTNLNAKDYMSQTLAVIELDKLLQKTPSAGKTVTATEIIDDILNAAKVGWTSPVFKPLTSDMTQEAIKLTRQENGWAALYEAVVMNQSYATIKKTYGFNVPPKLVNAIKKDDKAYQYMLRNRNKSVRLTDPRGTEGPNPDD